MYLIIRYTYLLGWVSLFVSLGVRALKWGGLRIIEDVLPVTSRGLFFLSGYLFVVCVASVAYAWAMARAEEERGSDTA
ncbi:MAG: hypothetical protein ACR2IF_10145 [Terriglobales bacterium]